MELITLIALATAAGFVFSKITGKAGKKKTPERRELSYSQDIVARQIPDNKSEFDISSIDVLPEYRLVKGLVEKKFPLIFYYRWSWNWKKYPGAMDDESIQRLSTSRSSHHPVRY